MFAQIKKLFKQLPVLVWISILFFGLAIGLYATPTNTDKKSDTETETIFPSLVPSITDEKNTNFDYLKTTNNAQSITPTIVVSNSSNGESQTTAKNQNEAKNESGNSQQQSKISVTLSINGSSVGAVSLDEGSNQCNVLSNAKDQGKISSLDMRYISSLGTNGVYKINGIGKDNAIWWVYKVNGASPSQGCSLVKANNNDNVDWEYVGN